MNQFSESDLIFPPPKKSLFREAQEAIIGIGLAITFLALTLLIIFGLISGMVGFFGALATAPAWVAPMYVLWLMTK